MVNKYLILIIALILLVIPVCAIPTTMAATSITSNGAILNCDANIGSTIFEYGQKSGSLTWKTPNFTGSNYTIYGSPLLGSTQYLFRVCDSTGCGAELPFTTSALVPSPQTTFGAGVRNITDSSYDLEVITRESIGGYFWLVPTFPAIVWGLLFFGIYLGLWIRERDLVVPVILGLISGSFILWSDSGLGLGIPLEFRGIAQGLAYAALAGIILAWVKRS